MMSDLSTMIERLRALVSERLFPLDDDFSAECDLYAEGLDSMALMQLILVLEQEVGVRIEPSDLGRENFQTLGAMARLVERKLAS